MTPTIFWSAYFAIGCNIGAILWWTNKEPTGNPFVWPLAWPLVGGLWISLYLSELRDKQIYNKKSRWK